MDSCPHGKDPDECLICWAKWNVEMEELRIESGLTREEFGRAIPHPAVSYGSAMFFPSIPTPFDNAYLPNQPQN
jgi:hypothetical protein